MSTDFERLQTLVEASGRTVGIEKGPGTTSFNREIIVTKSSHGGIVFDNTSEGITRALDYYSRSLLATFRKTEVNPVIDEIMRENVRQGIYCLDTTVPNWSDHIDFMMLEMGSRSLCILGQLFGSYDQGSDRLGVLPHSPKLVILGFRAPCLMNEEDLPAYYAALTCVWKEQIVSLKAEKSKVYESLAPRRLIKRKKSFYVPSYVYSHLPYIIHRDYARLVNLVRYLNRADRWRSAIAQYMIASQCERLHLSVYGSYCCYGAHKVDHLPSYIKGQGIVEASSVDKGGDA